MVDSTGSGYPAVVKRAPQTVSSLRDAKKPGAHMDPSVGDPNDEA